MTVKVYLNFNISFFSLFTFLSQWANMLGYHFQRIVDYNKVIFLITYYKIPLQKVYIRHKYTEWWINVVSTCIHFTQMRTWGANGPVNVLLAVYPLYPLLIAINMTFISISSFFILLILNDPCLNRVYL